VFVVIREAILEGDLYEECKDRLIFFPDGSTMPVSALVAILGDRVREKQVYVFRYPDGSIEMFPLVAEPGYWLPGEEMIATILPPGDRRDLE
jgi:hypothetical protein